MNSRYTLEQFTRSVAVSFFLCAALIAAFPAVALAKGCNGTDSCSTACAPATVCSNGSCAACDGSCACSGNPAVGTPCSCTYDG
jgi:hypothetical protein